MVGKHRVHKNLVGGGGSETINTSSTFRGLWRAAGVVQGNCCFFLGVPSLELGSADSCPCFDVGLHIPRKRHVQMFHLLLHHEFFFRPNRLAECFSPLAFQQLEVLLPTRMFLFPTTPMLQWQWCCWFCWCYWCCVFSSFCDRWYSFSFHTTTTTSSSCCSGSDHHLGIIKALFSPK